MTRQYASRASFDSALPVRRFARIGLALAAVFATCGTTACISKKSKAPRAALVRLDAPAAYNLEKLASTGLIHPRVLPTTGIYVL
jgi:hypothetical protein